MMRQPYRFTIDRSSVSHDPWLSPTRVDHPDINPVSALSLGQKLPALGPVQAFVSPRIAGPNAPIAEIRSRGKPERGLAIRTHCNQLVFSRSQACPAIPIQTVRHVAR